MPTWSRNYRTCHDKKSEINCEQLLEAYSTIFHWDTIRKSLTLKEKEKHLLHIKPLAGLGNKMYHILTGFMTAFALNKSVEITNPINAIVYPDSVIVNMSRYGGCGAKTHRSITGFEHWQKKQANQLIESDLHLTVTYCYPYFILMDPYLSSFTYQHFGRHFAYFIFNFVAEISDDVTNIVFQLFKPIPKKMKVIGVHLRHYHGGSRFYVSSISKVNQLVIPFLKDLFHTGLYIALATDKQEFVNRIKIEFPDRLIIADVERKSDGNSISALTDICLLMMCNMMIATFRSSFSAFAAQRSMLKPYWIDMENPYLFQFTNSQAGIVSTIMENLPHDFNYVLNFRARLFPSIEKPMHVFFRNMAL
ncbi:hypothetical protein TRFO_22489 [Tritrichomonas foetus]|uniref:Uncharacterized protein n=1 Tax=Tritrichomonas foetus TaxID=1144522 RepID=A0A1J4KHT7_9EUKA|nr:hypothetical protein TRFO_22489 [Tritrichomonas foetus]|eukprot:OHT08893.1 hypothetical protein TRFO_22489 [Tritrichomonas foetus]